MIEVVAGGDVQNEAYTDIARRRDGQFRLPQRSERGRGQEEDRSSTSTENGHGRKEGQLQAPRLGVLASALLGRAYPDGPLRQVRLGACCLKISCRMTLPEVEHYEPTDTGECSAGCDDRLGQHHLPALRRPRQARDRYHAAVGRLQLVLPALYRSAQRQVPGRSRKSSSTGCRSTGITAAWSIPRCTCYIRASGTASCTTSAWCPPPSRMRSAPAHGMILGDGRRKDVQVPRQRHQPRRYRR